jgi:ATP-dependent RNA helicase DeaD
MNFKELELSPTILASISEMGFETPTQVQEEVIPLILEENDLIVMAKTGSGKTGAFGLPMLHMMEKDKLDAVKIAEIEKASVKRGPEGLILTPTRELAVQVDSDIQKMSKYMELKTTAVYGQHNMDVEIKSLSEGVSIVTGTPGRVNDHIQRKTLITRNVKFLVLDEADRMLDMGFYDQVMDIIKTLPKNRVTLLFSATMPAEIKKICREYMKHPVTVELDSDTKTVDTIRQIYHRVEANKKRHSLERVLRVEQPDSCMVFCNTRHEVDKVTEFLQKQGFYAKALHGAKDQNSRLKTINSFRDGKIQILVATDVAARGIHIDDLTLVINYDVPDKQDSYVHRIGRTGRAGNGGLAISLVTTDDIMSLYELEVHVGCLIEEVDLPTEEAFEAAKDNVAGRWANKPYVMVSTDYLQKNNNVRVERGQGHTKQTMRSDQRPYKKEVLHNEKVSSNTSKDNYSEKRRDPKSNSPKVQLNSHELNPIEIKNHDVTKHGASTIRVKSHGANTGETKIRDTKVYEAKVQNHKPHEVENFDSGWHDPKQAMDKSQHEGQKNHYVAKKKAEKTNKYSTKYAVIDRTEEIKQKKKEEIAKSSKGIKKIVRSIIEKLFKA